MVRKIGQGLFTRLDVTLGARMIAKRKRGRRRLESTVVGGGGEREREKEMSGIKSAIDERYS